jgi:uncharacterized protein (DUF305 family)
MLRPVNMPPVPELLQEAVPGRGGRRIDTFARYVDTPPVIVRRCLPVVVVAVSLGACGAGAAAPPAPPAVSSAPAFGGTDRAWVEISIAMGEELLPLLALAPQRSADPAVRRLAAEVTALHQRELAILYELHAAAGLPAENPHKGMPMPGMVTPEQVTEAAGQTDGAFDALLLRRLREHAEQGVRLATSEQKSGAEPRAKALATRMLTDRRACLRQISAAEK